MLSRVFIVALALSLTSGCVHPDKKKNVVAPPIRHVEAPFQQFTSKNFDWSSVRRIVLMLPANQTAYPRVQDELQANLAAELQRAGRFEIVVATRDDPGARAQDIFTSGQFNELEVLRVAREYQSDAVLFANVTQYHPYMPPRIGLSLLLVSPAEGVVIASIGGLWDAREANTSLQAQAAFKQTQNWPRSLLGNERVIESPDVFQRFVCQQIAGSLQPPGSGAGIAVGLSIPAETSTPINGAMQSGMEIPPVPPSSMEVP